jgi:predicted transcriptional regulator of viral defense system
MNKSEKQAISMIENMGGTIRTSDALKQGIHRRTLYALRDSGLLTQISRGVYSLADMPVSNPDLITIGTRAPNAVVCLISALAFHNITTQIPHAVFIAVPKDTTPPRIDYPPISVHKFSGEALTAGIEEHKIEGVPVKIYSVEKTLADCFKYRNKIGLDVCIEALKLYKSNRKINIHDIIKYAKICRVYKIITPHLESIL